MVTIKKITIYGFKSFGPRRNTIDIPRGFTVITGPNGGGKSNVIDAVKFALGELSPHALRVSRLSELIYESNGSKSGYARVSVVFDNSDRGIPMDADEVTVTRRLMQSGESVYQVNGKSVSRMELLTLLSAANIKPSGYNIISQGAVLGIAETSPEELRKLIDEIAGTAEYDRRKAEALEQLDQAERNIAVARAGTLEVKQRVRQLELEKTQLIRRSILERELTSLKAEKLRSSIVEMDSELARLLEDEEKILQEKTMIEEELARLNSHRASLTEKVAILEAELSKKTKIEEELSSTIETSRAELERLKTSIRSDGTRLSSIRRQLLEIMLSEESAKARLNMLNELLSQLLVKDEEAAARLASVEDEIEKLEKSRNEISGQLRELEEEIAKHKREEESFRRVILEKERLLEAKTGRIASLRESLQEKKNKLAEISEEIDRLQNVLSKNQESLKILIEDKDRLEHQLKNLSNTATFLRSRIEKLSSFLAEVERLIIEGRAKISPESRIRREISDIVSSSMNSEVVGVLSELFRPPRGLEALYIRALGDRLNSLVVRRSSVAAALIMAAAESGVELSVISLEEPYQCLGEECLACMAETSSIEGARALHIALRGARLLRESRELRAGKPAINIDGAYWDGYGYLASLGKTKQVQKIIDIVNDLARHEELLKKKIDELEKSARMLDEEVESLRAKKIEIETSINAVKEKIKVDEKSLTMLRYEKSRLENSISHIEKEIENLSEEAALIRSELEKLSEKWPSNEKIDATTRTQLVEKLDEINRSIARYASIRSELLSDKKAIRQRIDEISREAKRLEDLIKEIFERRAILENASEEYKRSVRTYALKYLEVLEKQRCLLSEGKKYLELISGLRTEVASLRSLIDEDSQNLEKLRTQLSELESRYQAIRMSKIELTMRRSALEEKLRELPAGIEGDMIHLDPGVKEEIYAELESELNSMGPVNQLAASQYLELVENYKHRSFRIAELEKERREILRVIELIDAEKQEIFMSTLRRVSEGFGYFFNRLTGGEAWLELSEPDKPNESGVEMIVKFVGKSPRSSRSVSGGEKSVAAVSLLMSFQGLTPADFLIFDEVDAHMDASYTKNLSELFSEMSRKTQIIAISLKDIMAERSELLVGVYNKAGESRIVVTKMGEKINEN